MSFGYPSYLWLLLAIPPGMLVFFWWSGRERRRLMTQFIQARLLPGLVSGISTTRQKISAACLILAAACLIFALAQPRWGYDMEEVSQKGLDIVVAIDTSKSMLAADIAPNRLARAKLAALDLMQQAKSDRLGLVVFAGSAFLQCPLTVDDTVFRQGVEALDVNTIPEGGTALAEAIETAAKAFKEEDNYKVLVLFTDGEDHDSGALEAATKAAEEGLRIFTIGIGTAEGELLPPNLVRDGQGNLVKSHLNEALLQQIAGAAKGFYLPLRGANTMDVLYQKGLAPLPKTDAQEKWVRRMRERYHWPLAIALALLIVEMLLPERKRAARKEGGDRPHSRSSQEPRSSRREEAHSNPGEGNQSLLTSAATIQEDKERIGSGNSPSPEKTGVRVGVILCLLLPAIAFGSPASALRDYKAGKYDEALKEYERSLEKEKTEGADPRLHFNAGAAAYRNQKYDLAARHFTNALAAPDLALQERAYYNLGNTLYELGGQNPDPRQRMESWKGAVQQYDNAIKLNTNDADARFNHEFVKKKLEELKQQEQQQQKQDSKQDQSKQNQDQQQKDQKDQSKDQQKQQEQQQQQQKQDDKKQDSNQQQQAQDKQQQEKNQQQQQAKQSEEKKKQEAERKKQEEERKKQDQSEQQKAQKSDGQEEKEGGQEQQVAAGQMTPQEARQLLDSQKDDELTLPVSRKDQKAAQRSSGKDW